MSFTPSFNLSFSSINQSLLEKISYAKSKFHNYLEKSQKLKNFIHPQARQKMLCTIARKSIAEQISSLKLPIDKNLRTKIKQEQLNPGLLHTSKNPILQLFFWIQHHFWVIVMKYMAHDVNHLIDCGFEKVLTPSIFKEISIDLLQELNQFSKFYLHNKTSNPPEQLLENIRAFQIPPEDRKFILHNLWNQFKKSSFWQGEFSFLGKYIIQKKIDRSLDLLFEDLLRQTERYALTLFSEPEVAHIFAENFSVALMQSVFYHLDKASDYEYPPEKENLLQQQVKTFSKTFASLKGEELLLQYLDQMGEGYALYHSVKPFVFPKISHWCFSWIQSPSYDEYFHQTFSIPQLFNLTIEKIRNTLLYTEEAVVEEEHTEAQDLVSPPLHELTVEILEEDPETELVRQIEGEREDEEALLPPLESIEDTGEPISPRNLV